MAVEKLSINQIVDPLAARVVISPHATDPDRLARFDISGVPRVDRFLVGRQAAQVPTMVTRLCGLCPVTHHLAGIAALDALVGVLPGEDDLNIRRVMHHGSVIEVMGSRLAMSLGAAHGRQAAIELRTLGKKALALAGVPGHFPDVAVPGGVRRNALPTKMEATALVAEIGGQLHAARQLAEQLVGAARARSAREARTIGTYEGANLFASTADGAWDPLGRYLTVDYREATETFPAAELSARVRETQPGSITPCPQVRVGARNEGHANGDSAGKWVGYRVGPAARHPDQPVAVAQALSVGESLDALATLIAAPLATRDGTGDDKGDLSPAHIGEHVTGTGIGIVDGPRGLLVHTYEVADGVLTDCDILSPTAQNEPWLAQMLSRAYREHADFEAAVRAADPCLPCTQAPVGAMNIDVVTDMVTDVG